MVEYPNSVVMTEQHMEIVQNREMDFPYVAMEADLHRYAGNGTPWHWHDHFEIGVVYRGELELCTQQGRMILKAGEGYFLNANVLHLCRAVEGTKEACIHTQLFTRQILSGTGLIGRRYIATVENCVALECVPLYPDCNEHLSILGEINRAFEAAEEDAHGYEIFVSAHLCAAWGGIYRLMKPEIEKAQGQPREDAVRAKTMLSFIYENYMNPISVKQISAAAGICERECFRCFDEVLGTTPLNYLNKHRVSVASRMLVETGNTVSEVAENCGFSNSSYFGKVFHRLMGCSPGEYRKKNS